jgi:GDP-4-dehydro-6-deoxy-D-mannose reductase
VTFFARSSWPRIFKAVGSAATACQADVTVPRRPASVELRAFQEPVLHVGNLDAKRDFLDVRDVVAAYVEAMASERLESGAILNIASGEARRVGDVLESLLKKAKVPIRTVADPARFRPVDIQATVGDARLARALLDWAPKIPFEQTLTDMLDAQRAKSVS